VKCGIISKGVKMHLPLSWEIRFAKLLIVIGEIIFKRKRCVHFEFIKVRILGSQNYVEGDVTHMKLEFVQNIDINAAPTGGDYQHGTASFSVQAADENGGDVSDQFTVEVDPENELHATVVRAPGNNTECSGAVTLRADGDPDAEEEAPITGVLGFNYDSPNATGFDMTGTAVTPEVPASGETAGATTEEPA
jgi:hypothetical protein